MAPSNGAPPIIFLHIGWAREYRGRKGDVPQGQFGFLKQTADTPGETLNFRSFKGRCFGYGAARSINLSRLGANAGAEHVDGVLVVWTATAPDKSGRFVVGWYENARVFADLTNRRPHEIAWVVCEARASDCHLVEVDDRTFFVPSMMSGWPGINVAYFAREHLSEADVGRLLAYVRGAPSQGFLEESNGVPSRTGRRGADLEARSQVEIAAVRAVVKHYEARGWTIRSVEDEWCGWDLEATFGRRKLLVEVKGRASDGPVEITPNEYAAMRSREKRMSYRLAVVHQARSHSPKITVFEYLPGTRLWTAESGETLQLTEKIGAVAAFERVGIRREMTD